ncbi:glycosyltransferase [Micromonospora sp. BRA006-A]|nr:glycosyltransferase [Micromonospora sp. BRA006-A]
MSLPTNPPALSVVMPTYQDPQCLALTLRALTRQTLPPERFEVIVVRDGGSSDGTPRRSPRAPVFACTCWNSPSARAAPSPATRGAPCLCTSAGLPRRRLVGGARPAGAAPGLAQRARQRGGADRPAGRDRPR